MKLMINGQEIEQKLPPNASLAGVLKVVEDDHVGENEVIVSITVDGEPLTAERLSIWKDRSATDFDQADVEVLARNLFAARGLRIIADKLQESIDLRDEIAEHLGQGRSQEAMQLMPRYLQVWSAVQQNLGSAARLLNLDVESLEVFDQSDPLSPQSRPVIDVIHHLSEQLEQIKTALETGDLVLLGDILDYEFSDLTDIWQDMLLQLADQFEPQE
ncbi:MAG: hypothetical protein JW860_02770 [Sedimentisphaerales bacterium]|nr:hypothetical protein [Sedimentisphaerales bacterium]